MKQLSTFILALSLVLLCAGAAMGMPNPPGSPDIDTRYSIEDEEPFFSGGFYSVPDYSFWNLTGDYYQNDFFFFTGSYSDQAGATMIGVTGSYIFDSGFFAAFSIWDYPWGSYYGLFPGYRWTWDERGYLAFSLDYNSEYGVEGLDIHLKYRADALVIRGELYIAEDYDYDIEASLAYWVGEALTVGGEFDFEDGSLDDLEAGATWKPGSWVFDLWVDEGMDYEFSGVCYFGDFGLGLEYDGDSYTFKAKYDTGDARFALFFRPEQDYFPQNYELSYTRFF